MKYFFTFSCAFLFISCLFVLARGNAENIGLATDLKQEKVGSKTDDNVVQREEQAISDEGFSVAEKKALEGRQQNFEYQAEINRLMSLIVNSLYSNREIFLRELISNASDALDKLRYLALTDKSFLNKDILKEEESPKLEIRIKIDQEKKLIHVRDTGIGMTKEDLVNNLGRIAKSGTKEWMDKVNKGDNTNQIGQFGVGFYSTFLIADVVSVTTKHAQDKQYVWESIGEATSSFTITEDPRGNTLGRGTLITMQVKEDAEEYLDQDKLKLLIEKYSEFINFPIYLQTKKEISKEVTIAEEVADTPAEEKPADASVEDDEEEEEAAPKTKTVKETVYSWELINETKPLWTRKPADVTEEEYTNFYKSIAKATDEPMQHIHFTAEGDVDFTALLYIPSEPPFGMFDNRVPIATKVKLYVRRVFITDKFEDFMPKYLAFIAGIVDSDDLPLNVSREMLQQHKTLSVIKKKLIRKAIAMFQELEEDEVKFAKFLENFGTNIKLGVIEDMNNRSRLLKLLRYTTAKNRDKQIGLEEYVKNMKEGQDEIYYLGGETKESIAASPFLGKLTKKGYDVLFLTEPIDEYVVQTVGKYESKYKFVDISKDGLKLDEDKDEIKKQTEQYQPLLTFLKDTLEKNVDKVVISSRLSASPCALVSASYGHSANMERIIKAQALADKRYKSFNAASKKTLEINPQHPIIKELLEFVTNDNKERATRVGELLYETAVIELGYSLDEPTKFADHIHRLMADSLGIDTTEWEKLQDEAPEAPSAEKSKDEL